MGVLSSAKRARSSGNSRRFERACLPLGHGRAAGAQCVLTRTDWRSTAEGVRVISTGSGLAIDIPMSAVAGDIGAWQRSRDGLPRRPTLGASRRRRPPVAESLAGVRAGALAVQGLDSNTSPCIRLLQPPPAAARPRRCDPDLGALKPAQAGPTFPVTSEEVWLGPQAPANAVSRFRAAGLGIDKLSARPPWSARPPYRSGFRIRLHALGHAPRRARRRGRYLQRARRRRPSTRHGDGRAGGHRRAAWILVGSLAIEAGILALTALFGVAAGACSAAIVLPSLPQLAAPTDAPLSYALPVSLILAVARARCWWSSSPPHWRRAASSR